MSADGQIHEGYIKNTDNGKISKKAVDTIEELAEKATLDAKRAVEDAENAVAAAEAAKNAVSAAAANVQAKTVANAAAQSAYQSNLSDLKLQEAAKAAAEAEAKAKNQFAQAQAKDIDAGNDITTKKVEADNAKVKAKALNKKADEWTKEVGKRRKKVGEESSVSWTSNALENTGSSINKYEDEIIPDAQRAIETENKKRMWDYAEDIEARSKGRRDLGITKISNLINGGQHGAHEAASNIRRGAKLDSHGGGHGGGGPKPRPRRSSSGGGGGDDHGGGGAAHH